MSGQPQYALCIDNVDYSASLELHKSYPARRFLRVRLPQTVRAALSGADSRG